MDRQTAGARVQAGGEGTLCARIRGATQTPARTIEDRIRSSARNRWHRLRALEVAAAHGAWRWAGILVVGPGGAVQEGGCSTRPVPPRHQVSHIGNAVG